MCTSVLKHFIKMLSFAFSLFCFTQQVDVYTPMLLNGIFFPGNYLYKECWHQGRGDISIMLCLVIC